MTPVPDNGDNSDDAYLIQRCSDGDTDAFEEIVTKYRSRIFNITRRVVRDSGDAEDVMQEVFIKLFKNLRRLKNPARLKSWLYSVALNQSRSLLRWRRVRSYLSLGLVADPIYRNRADSPYAAQASPQDSVEGAQTALVLEKLADTLPESLKIPLLLKYSDRLSENEIADIMKLSTNAVKIRVSRARELLWKAFQKAGKDDEIK